jgi:hypothetical protein
MENSSNNFEENMTQNSLLDEQVPDSDLHAAHFDGPGDEDEEEEGGEEMEDDNPPLDEDVVHSPVPTQSGGRPEAANDN